MKKIISIATVFVLCISLMLPMLVWAAGASATLTGPGTVRAGDTITLYFNLNGSGILGASGTLSYNSSQVTLTGTAQKIASPWAVEFNGNNFVAYDNEQNSPINGGKTLFAVTFKVKSLSVGTKIKISYTNVISSDGSADTNIGTVSYETTIAAPMSTNNNLKSLNVSNATISPAFSAGTINYTAEVPFSVSKLNVTANASESKAKVSVDSPNLVPGGTTKVAVTVTAENGSTKTYTITVKRAQDPNYVASGNNNLSGIQVEGFLLSPVFSSEKTQYVVWLPYETTSVKVTATTADSKATVEVVGGEGLVAGQDNLVQVICTAENGDKKEYKVVVKRAAAHNSSAENLPGQTTPNVTEPTKEPTSITNPENNMQGFAWWWLMVVGGAALAVGIVAGFLVRGMIKKD